MPALRLTLLTSALLVLGLSWSVTACQPQGKPRPPPPPGFVTRYATPMANLSVDKLVGRWYVAEEVSESPSLMMLPMCVIFDFHYDDNNTPLVESHIEVEGVIDPSSEHQMPVSDNGVWDRLDRGVPKFSQAVVDLSEDNRYLAVTSCMDGNTLGCATYVMVRDIEDAGRHDKLREVHRRLGRAGVGHADSGIVKNSAGTALRPLAIIMFLTGLPRLKLTGSPSGTSFKKCNKHKVTMDCNESKNSIGRKYPQYRKHLVRDELRI